MRVNCLLFGCLLFLCVAGANAAFAVPLPSDANLLSGQMVTMSTEYSTDYLKENATDGEATGQFKDAVFAQGDGDQRMVISGLNTGLSYLRIWSGDLLPKQVTIKSSVLNTTSLSAGSYETTLLAGPFSLTGQWINTGPGALSYFEVAVSAPLGTQSLFLDFDGGNGTTGDAGFARISEVQAFFNAPPVPEPGTLLLGTLGCAGYFSALSRRRRLAKRNS